MLLSDIEKIAEKYGMEPCGYDFIDADLTGVEFRDKETKETTLFVNAEFTPEYEDELSELELGTEYEIDSTKCFVRSCCVYGKFVNESGFLDASTNGIILYDECEFDDDRYFLPLSLLEKCIDYQRHPITHSIDVLNAHIKHLEIIRDRFKPILDEFCFEEGINTFFNIDEQQDNTHIQVWYTFDKLNEVYFYTDCVTCELIFNDVCPVTNMTADEFRDLFMKDVVYRDNATINLDFEFVFHKGEKGWNKNTATNIYQIEQDLNKGYRRENEVDYDSVPEKYNSFIEQHKQLPTR